MVLTNALKDQHAALDELLFRARNSPLSSHISERKNKTGTWSKRGGMEGSVEDPLRLEGEFPQRERRFWSPGDQVGPCNREDNLIT